MNAKTLFIVAATIATMITGCETLDKGALASGGLAAASSARRGDGKAQAAVAVGAAATAAAMSSDSKPSQTAQRTGRELNTSQNITSGGESDMRTVQAGGVVTEQMPQQTAEQRDTEKAKPQEEKPEPVNIAG